MISKSIQLISVVRYRENDKHKTDSQLYLWRYWGMIGCTKPVRNQRVTQHILHCKHNKQQERLKTTKQQQLSNAWITLHKKLNKIMTLCTIVHCNQPIQSTLTMLCQFIHWLAIPVLEIYSSKIHNSVSGAVSGLYKIITLTNLPIL